MPGFAERPQKRGPDVEVLLVVQNADPLIPAGGGIRYGAGGIGAAVVDEQDLPRGARGLEGGGGALEEGPQKRRFVESPGQERERGRHGDARGFSVPAGRGGADSGNLPD